MLDRILWYTNRAMHNNELAWGAREIMHETAQPSEFALIARLTRGLPGRDDVLLGVGDDAAILDVGNAGEVLVATCDAQVEGTHFRLDRATPQEIGRRALAVNASDIAAMGAQPRFALVSLLVPPALKADLLEGIYAGLREECERYGVALVGGNVARNPERLVLDVTLLGMGERDHLLRRSGAQPGDVVCVTGTVGSAAAGLRLLDDAALLARIVPEISAPLLTAQRTPVARVTAGHWLAHHGATAAIDISDGLAADLAHLCRASGVGVVVNMATLPIRDETRVVADSIGCSADDLALNGGEDYELLFTVRSEQAARVAAELPAATGTPVTAIGTIQAETGLWRDDGGTLSPLAPQGWDHLRASGA